MLRGHPTKAYLFFLALNRLFIKFINFFINIIVHVYVWDHSYSTSIQSVEENCAHDQSYVKNTSLTKIPVIDPLCIICIREIATMEWAIIFYRILRIKTVYFNNMALIIGPGIIFRDI